MRRVSIGILLGLLFLLAAHAQSSAAVSGLVRGPEGKALPAARITLYPETASELSWLAELLPPPLPRSSHSEASGRFRIESPSGRGSLWIEHENGLGGISYGIDPGVPGVLKTAPMAEISLVSKATFRVEIRGIKVDGTSVYLGRREGRELRMPAGDFILLLHLAEQSFEIPIKLRSGERRQIPVPDARTSRLLNWDPSKRDVFLIGWPHPIRPGTNAGTLPVAWGIGRLRISIILNDREPRNRLLSEHWYRPQSTLPMSLPWTRSIHVQAESRQGQSLAGVTVCGIAVSNAGITVHSLGYTDEAGQLETVRRLSPQSTHLVGLIEGHAATVQPIDDGVSEYRLTLGEPRKLRMRILDPSGKPLAGARVEVLSKPTAILKRSTYSNGRGEVAFQGLSARGCQVRIDHQRFQPMQFQVPLDELIPSPGSDHPYRSVQLARGAGLSGRVVNRQGQGLPAVRVQLRAEEGLERPLERSVQSSEDGSFSFEGLPEEVRYTLFAQAQIEGITWSGRESNLETEDHIEIVLSSEDPPLPSKK